MASVKIVLYAEGSGEDRVVDDDWSAVLVNDIRPAPGDPLMEAFLGPAHVLIRRIVEEFTTIPSKAIEFQAPLTPNGRVARGSELLARPSLRRLLTWPSPSRAPDLAIVLVDQDDEPGRRDRLESYVEDLPVRRVLAVAIKEFEAWLIADMVAVRVALGLPGLQEPGSPEGMEPREAKELLGTWTRQSPRIDDAVARLDVASTCTLAVLNKRCSHSFKPFVDDLCAAMVSLGKPRSGSR